MASWVRIGVLILLLPLIVFGLCQLKVIISSALKLEVKDSKLLFDAISHAIDDPKKGNNLIEKTFTIYTKPTVQRLFTETPSNYIKRPTRSIFQPFKIGSLPSTQPPTISPKKDLIAKSSLFKAFSSSNLKGDMRKSDIQEVMNKLGIELDNGKPLLTVATTIINTSDSAKIQIQKNCLQILNSFYPYVQTVLFDSNGLTSGWSVNHIIINKDVPTNPHGTPYFTKMVQYLERNYESTFYGYCNGDLLFHSDLIPALYSVYQHMKKGEFKQNVFMVGRRVNYDHMDVQPIPAGIIETQNRIISQYASKGYLFQTDAEDYFFFTKHCLPWSSLADVVIGRPGYDNYLVDYVFYRRQQIELIDMTNAILIVHQTDKDGSKAGFRDNPDRNWNLQRIGNHWYMGRTEYTPWHIQRDEHHQIILQEHGDSGVEFQDVFLKQEDDLLRRYIKQTDVCLYFAHRAVKGSLLKMCKQVITVLWDSRSQAIMKRRFDNNPQMRIIYAYGSEQPGLQMQQSQHFQNYINIARTHRLQFDVVINDGHVKPQVAYALRDYLPKDQFMIVFGTALPNKQYYKEIHNFYSVVEEVNEATIAGQEFTGITVYRNSKQTEVYNPPSWW